MKTFICNDGCAELEIQAENARQAAELYVAGGDFGEITKTIWISVSIWEKGDDEDDAQRIKVDIDPDTPECSHEDGHVWGAPHSVLGGLKDNPGVWGNGGGVKITEVCKHCGKYKVEDSWAQDPEDGEQGLHSIEYNDSDEYSEPWLEYLSAKNKLPELLAEHGEDALDAAIEKITGNGFSIISSCGTDIRDGDEWIHDEPEYVRLVGELAAELESE